MSANFTYSIDINSGIGFNPRARDERERVAVRLLAMAACFNPRARDERECQRSRYLKCVHCFNPRARDERELIS